MFIFFICYVPWPSNMVSDSSQEYILNPKELKCRKRYEILFALKNDVQYSLTQYWKRNPKEIIQIT